MAFKVLSEKQETGRRVLISGPPNTLKTTSLLTWPKPLHIVSLPGEKGYETIPVGKPDIIPYVWEYEDPTKRSPASIIREVEVLVVEIVTGKRGEVKTLGLDGLHKMYAWYFQQALSDQLSAAQGRKNWDGDEEKLRGPSYGRAHEEFSLWLTRTLGTKVPYIAATVWEGKTKDDSDNRDRNAPSHIFPDLPGEMAKRIVGEFSVVLYSEVGLPDMNGKVKGTWQIRPGGKVWGVGVKIAPEIAQTLPAKVPQDFSLLEPLLKGEKTPQTQAAK